MTTDNRANEPTEAQVEAAAKAMYEEERSQTLEGQQWPRWHELCEDNPWSSRCGHKGTKVPYLTLARAALVAAQDAAPQASQCGARWLREEGSENIPPGDWHCALPLNHGGNHVDGADGTRWGRHRDYGGVPGDAVGTFYPPTGVAPVLPSSTVDEDALMAELDRHNPRYDFKRQVSNCACGWKFKNHVEGAHSVHRARAVAEWLKEQGQ